MKEEKGKPIIKEEKGKLLMPSEPEFVELKFKDNYLKIRKNKEDIRCAISMLEGLLGYFKKHWWKW